MNNPYEYIEQYYGKKFAIGDRVIYTSYKGEVSTLTVVKPQQAHYVRAKGDDGIARNYHPNDVSATTKGGDDGDN